jgi:hypothetical protein
MHDEFPIENMVLLHKGLSQHPEWHHCKHVDLCLWNTYNGIKAYVYEMKQLGTPHRSRNDFPNFHRDSFEDGSMNDATWRALQWTQFLRLYTLVSDDMSALDEVSRGIRHCFQTFTVPIWVTFGMQLLFDIQDLLGNILRKPFIEMQHRVRQVRHNLDFCIQM